MKKISMWIPHAIMLGVIVLGALLSGPQPLSAQEGSEFSFFTPADNQSITIDCGDGEQYVWATGELRARTILGGVWEVEAFEGKWCRMPQTFTLKPQQFEIPEQQADNVPINTISQPFEGVEMPEWVPGATIITLIATFLFVAAVCVFRWRFKRQNSIEVRLDEVFNVTLY